MGGLTFRGGGVKERRGCHQLFNLHRIVNETRVEISRGLF